MMGLSRGTFYRYKTTVYDGGIQALFDQNYRKANIKNRVEQNVEEAAIEFPAHGQHRTSNELRASEAFLFRVVGFVVFGFATN